MDEPRRVDDVRERVRALLPEAVEKRIIGGTGFMVDGALACSVSMRGLLVRLRPSDQDAALAEPGVEPMVMGGRSSRGWVHVDLARLGDEAALRVWVDRGVAAARAAGG
ncbi:MAG: TfoX/Sxy family protein, partial [Phycicoccus sp.]